MEEGIVEEADGNAVAEAAPALIAVHPMEQSVAVAVGSELRIYDIKVDCPICLSDESGGPSHSDAIRAVSFAANGTLFASAGDDKLVKIWNTNSWCCIWTVYAEKRVSAVAITYDGSYVTFADKFGVVWLVSLDKDNKDHVLVDKKAVPILGHYCSIISSMFFSPDGRFIATADRDFKIRITLFPKKPLRGAHGIQSFCLGHTGFISCLAFIPPSDNNQGFLLSGGGDSTVRMWDYINGRLLDTCEVGTKAGLLETSEAQEEGNHAVLDICCCCDGLVVAVAIQSLNGVMLLNCDSSAKRLSFAKVITMEKCYIPTSLALCSSMGCLWTVMGASNLFQMGNSAQLLTRLRIVSGFKRDPKDPESHGPVVLEDNEVPGGEELLLTLQGSLDIPKQAAVLDSAAAAVKASMRNTLTKKQYSVAKRELRKSSRNDKKIKKHLC